MLGIINIEISCPFLSGALIKNEKAKLSSGIKITAPDFKQQSNMQNQLHVSPNQEVVVSLDKASIEML